MWTGIVWVEGEGSYGFFPWESLECSYGFSPWEFKEGSCGLSLSKCNIPKLACS